MDSSPGSAKRQVPVTQYNLAFHVYTESWSHGLGSSRGGLESLLLTPKRQSTFCACNSGTGMARDPLMIREAMPATGAGLGQGSHPS